MCAGGAKRAGVGAAWRAGLIVLAALAVPGCAVVRPGAEAAGRCSRGSQDVVDRLCQQDEEVRTLWARFRADVELGEGERQTSDGILVVRRPDAVRVKMFGPGGLTVYDALWRGDAASIRGLVRRPLQGAPVDIVLEPGATGLEPDLEMTLGLWSLWQPRCRLPPTAVAAQPGWLRLDPHGAHLTARDVRVGPDGVDEERLVRAPDELKLRYLERDCAQPAFLPGRIEMESTTRGWRATVRILEQEANASLADGLFAWPADFEHAP